MQKTKRPPAPPPEQRVVLSGISWETYESLLADYDDNAGPRFTYDRGVLEIMSPSPEHEVTNRLIAHLILTVMEELDVDAADFGSATFRREDLERGFEPDTCFYMESVERVRGKKRLDLTIDPPPDLVLEIDITSPSLDKLPIYARLGVPEVWRYGGGKLEFLLLESGEYKQVAESPRLPGFTGEALTKLIEEGEAMRRPEWLKKVREAARKAAR